MNRPHRTTLALLPLHVAALVGLSSVGATVLVGTAPHAQAAGVCAGPASAWPKAAVKLGASTVKLGGTLVVNGTGWCHPDGTGSRLGVKIDEGGIARTDAEVHTNKTIWALVEADENGEFTARIQLPDGTAATSTPALGAGEHTMRLLTGSLKAGDTQRNLLADPFTVTDDAVVSPEPPAWPAQERTSEGATVWVEDEVGTGDSATVRVRGLGWKKTDGTPSTVAVKLSSSSTTQYVRPTGEVIQHPTAAGDNTVWALFTPEPSDQRHVFRINADGSFEATLDLPRGLVDGDYLTVSLASGRFATGDRTRSIHTNPLLVGNARGSAESNTGGECTPTSARPTIQVPSTPVPVGGTLRITGSGWCNPAGGGSRIAVKIDEGAFSRLDSAVHSNRTIWTVVQARASDGTFAADVVLPDGTTATSTPAITTGSHTLRLLSGSLAVGDASRTLLSDPFTIGTHRPNGTPEPFAAEDLTDRLRGGVAASVTGRRLGVYVPGGRPGDWVHLSAYLPNSSPTFPWGAQWYRLDAAGRVDVEVPTTAPAGPVKLVVTNGNQSRVGDLIGWDDVVLPASATPTETPDATGADTTDDVGATKKNATPNADDTSTPTPTAPGPVTPASVAALVAAPVDAPLSEPQPPAKNFVGVGVLDRAGVTSSLTGTRLTVTFPSSTAGQLVHTRVYGADDVPAGWGMLTDAGELMLDLKDLPAGTYRFAFQGTDGSLLGWTEVTWSPSRTPDPSLAPAPEEAVASPIRQAGARWAAGPLDGILLGVGALGVAISTWLRRRRGGVA